MAQVMDETAAMTVMEVSQTDLVIRFSPAPLFQRQLPKRNFQDQPGD
jgi:hypothetical protein